MVCCEVSFDDGQGAKRWHLCCGHVAVVGERRLDDCPTQADMRTRDTHDNRVGGFAKHRWRIRFAPLEEAGSLFESERGRFEQSIIIGHPECYQIESM